MTCIAGVRDGGKVYLGGDSAGVGGYDLTVRADQKVFANGPFLFGFTSSFRMGQLLRYALVPPNLYDREVMHFMCTDFIDAVRNALKAGGYATKDKEQESGGAFLVGFAGRLFAIHSDYQVAEAASGYDAVGCGEAYAKGALFASIGESPVHRINMALRAAEAHSAGVRAPFLVINA
jgi:ATP-dependent protease HslVU (ClpYQ) peptidase subunit